MDICGYRTFIYGTLLAIIAAAFVCANAVAADEYRAAWVTGWESGFLRQSEVDKLLGVPGNATSKGDIRNANCNAVFVEVRRRADVCYPSGMNEPYFSGLTPENFNALQAIINAAHDTTGGKKRIEVHCWIVTFATNGGDVYSRHNNPADPENYWPTLDDSGNETDDKAFDPGHPKCEEYTVNVCMDLVNNFDIDGIHFDYIRFTGPDQGYNPTSIARYNSRYCLTGQPDAGDELFKQWRRDQVTAVVRQVYAKVQAVKPWIKVSGAFIGGTPSPAESTREAFENSKAYSQYYSDWDGWLHEGIVDMAVPMTYFDNVSRPTDYTNWINFDKDRKANRFMVIGPGTYLNYLQDAIDQILATRNASPSGHHADGFSVYSYQSPYSAIKGPDQAYGTWADFSAQLVSQVTPTWANIPQMPWKVTPTKGHIGGSVTYAPAWAWADGAYVRISGPETRGMRCDGTGFYAFIDLTPGTYTVTADYGSFEQQRTIAVSAGNIANGNFNLSVTDITLPVVNNVQVTDVLDGGAIISWTTNEPSTSQVEYDFVPYFGQSTAENPAKLTEHSVMLQGLTPNTAYHFRVKSVNGAGLVGYSGDFAFTTQSPTSQIIIDELDAGCALAGGWSIGTSAGGWNGSYKYTSCVNGTPTATATWTPVLTRSGPYDVSLYYREGSNRPTDARFVIHYAGGSVNINVNQTLVGHWLNVGTGLPFNMGTTGNVVLTNQTSNTLPKSVIADAVMFEYKGDTTPPVMNAVTDDQYTTSTTGLNALWSGADAESGIQNYRYAVGTQPGMSDVKAWTDAGTATSVTIGDLSLEVDHTYYISVRAINGAGFTSAPMNSTGIRVAHAVASIAEAKGLADGCAVSLPFLGVSAAYGNRFYTQDADRTSGIRIDSGLAVLPNQLVQVCGILALDNGCERAITNCKIVTGN